MIGLKLGVAPLLTAAVVLSLTGVGVVAAQAQERERDERARQRLEQAEQALESALRDLEEAMAMLRREESGAAQRRLRTAIRGMQSAERRLRAGRSGLTVDVAYSARRPQMGVYLRTGRNPARDSIGAELRSVVQGGPADEAGLRAGDIITLANGESLAGRRSAASRLAEIKNRLEVGDTLHVEYRRGNETHSADIILDRLDHPYAFAVPDIEVRVPEVDVVAPFIARFLPSGWLDIELVTLDAELGRYFGTDEGLLVISAPRDESWGLKSGDVILSIDGRKPTSQSHLVRIVRSYEPGEAMQIDIMRDKRRQTVTATVPERDRGFYWEDRR